MRLRLVGYGGARPPVPGVSGAGSPAPPGGGGVPPPEPEPDPGTPSEALVVVLQNDVPFTKSMYMALGYNRFDVMCIGGAGGRGEGVKLTTVQSYPGYSRYQRSNDSLVADIFLSSHDYFNYNHISQKYGGAGGGGGSHRVKGRLVLLPSSVPVIVGQAGNDAPLLRDNGTSDALGSGSDGWASSFGGTICRASGGKGGGPIAGGVGGVGNALTAGGGGVEANPGTWDGVIGKGGGGGSGGHRNGGTTTPTAKAGGAGASSTTDPTVSGPGGDRASVGITFDEVYVDRQVDETSQIYRVYYGKRTTVVEPLIIPGAGGGAKPFPLNGSNVQYGSKANGGSGEGLVIIRLTAVVA